MENNPRETGIVYLWDLPENQVYLDLKEPFKTKFLETAKNLSNNNWNKLAREIKIKIPKDRSSTIIRNYRRGKLASLFLIKKISNFLVNHSQREFSLENVQKNLKLVKTSGHGGSIVNPKFPIDFNSKEGAIIISSLFHDGGITIRDKEPFYANTSKLLKNRFVKAVNDLTGPIKIISKIKFETKEVIFPKILGLILISVGIVPGKRVVNRPIYPKFISNWNNNLILEFLSQAIADDGWVYNPKGKFGYIWFNFTTDLTTFTLELRNKIRYEKIEKYMPSSLIGNKILFEKLGCKVLGPYFDGEKIYYNKDGSERRYTQEWKIQIRDWRSLNFLAKNLKIPLEYKQKRLEEIAKSERTVIRCNPKILRLFNNFGNEGVTWKDIVESSNFHPRTIYYQLKLFCDDGYLVKVPFNGGCKTRFKYILTEKGKTELSLI